MSQTQNFDFDVMVDLETLGIRPNAAIVAIGAWPFRLDGQPTNHPSFYRNVSAEDSIASGLSVSGETIMLWLRRPETAWERLLTPEPVDLDQALADFQGWCAALCSDGEPDGFRLWAHGENFDIPILESAYHASALKKPWRHDACRDARTLFHAADMDWEAEMAGLDGTECDVRAIARMQATLVKRAWHQLKGQGR